MTCSIVSHNSFVSVVTLSVPHFDNPQITASRGIVRVLAVFR